MCYIRLTVVREGAPALTAEKVNADSVGKSELSKAHKLVF